MQLSRERHWLLYLKANSTDSLTLAIKSSNQNLIIFLNKIQTTITGYKGCGFFAILDQRDPDTFPNGRMWLFFNPCFAQHNSLCVGSASKKVGLRGCAQRGLSDTVYHATSDLPGSMITVTFAHSASATGLSERDHTVTFSYIWSTLLPDCPTR
ncbi:unnamed protein product [Nyctereutes procyonoides]|uniref:(raccoon dog) hypothetical protein n=1 Tax=Nyctereutes procyonoides TaxID=34880 RepID=A0A811YJR7_NYCPR|nr:unnamed protein product [Nyctereutes procyonoides]